MDKFDYDSAIASWRKSLASRQALEPGDIEELESHLRDAIDANVERGLDPADAFAKAVAGIDSGFDEAVEEYRHRSANMEPRSRLFSSWWIPAMLPNVLKVMLRNFKRQPGYSLINIGGLAIGMACCFIILLYVQDELSYDAFHEKADRIYRVDQTNIWANFEGRFASTGPGVSKVLADGLPEIESVVRVNNPPDWLVTIEDESGAARYFEEPRVLAADSTFFDVFTSEFLEGHPDTALDAPFAVVITASTRERYFNGAPALGRTIRVGNPGEEAAYEVTGVVADMPRNAHFRFDLLESLASNANLQRRPDAWVWTVFVTYLVLNENASIEAVREKLPGVLAEPADAKLLSAFGMEDGGLEASGRTWEMYLTPLRDIHLRSAGAGNRIGVVSDILYVYVFSTIALLIIVLASINFMNLSTARSVHRAREVGVRKTLGSSNSGLVSQFLSESVLFSFLALLVALGIVFLTIQPFNEIASKQLSITDLATPTGATTVLGFTLLVGVLSGIYPALYLASFSPIQALRSGPTSISANRLSLAGLRNVLVVFQFAISIVLIACSIIVYRQLDFVQQKNLGFNKDNVLVLENVEKLGEEASAFKDLMAGLPGVVQVAQSNAVPPRIWYEDFSMTVGAPNDSEIAINSVAVDDDLISTLGLQLVEGREFQPGTEANSRFVILNEAAVRQFTWAPGASESAGFPIGQSILFSGNGVEYNVIGVVKDFNIYSLHSEILPLAIFHESSIVWQGPNRFLSIRFANGADVPSLIDGIREHWTAFAGNLPFDFAFLDDQLFEQYESEQRVGKVVTAFTGLAVFIAILGLLGLVSFYIEKKTKEIGVRKVLGATPSSIVLLLSRDMSRLIIVSMFIAIPTAWFVMNNWLQRFTYRIDVDASVFVAAGLSALVLAWMALGFQTIRAATRNPVLSLRSE